MLAALYYWLDLNGPDGKPSHSKILASLTQFTLLAGQVIVALHVTDITAGFVGLVLAVGVLPFGLDGVKVFLKSRVAPT